MGIITKISISDSYISHPLTPLNISRKKDIK
jgi:hypothetical protein